MNNKQQRKQQQAKTYRAKPKSAKPAYKAKAKYISGKQFKASNEDLDLSDCK